MTLGGYRHHEARSDLEKHYSYLMLSGNCIAALFLSNLKFGYVLRRHYKYRRTQGERTKINRRLKRLSAFCLRFF
jgi:hypothetical protein